VSRSTAARLVALAALGAVSSARAAEPAKPAPEQIEFFENKVRPVLVEQCLSCHSRADKKVKGGLALDTRAGVAKGGDSGPALVPGDPDKSLLIRAVRHTDPDVKMPPKGKLSPEQIAALEAWVKMGAPDPRDGRKVLSDIELLMARAKTHWAFRPVREPPVPHAKPPTANPVDAFIAAKLAEKGLAMSPEADKRTLVRRAYFDLHGLPPSPEEVAAFVADGSPDAFERLVDRLLASPRYGERWGRHWLDVARYADNQGSIFGGDPGYPYAYAYRDWVIRAFNEDMPFDRFVTLQLAADRFTTPDDNRDLAALGFVTLGRRPNGRVDDDVIDDRIDAVGRGLMGLTVACARCHDHKLEPVSTRDYYGFYGIIRSTGEPAEPPEIRCGPDSPQRAEWRSEKAKRGAAVEQTLARGTFAAQTDMCSRAGDYLAAVVEARGKPKPDVSKTILTPRKLSEAAYKQWEKALTGSYATKTHAAVLGPWAEFAALKPDEWAAKAPELARKFATVEPPAKADAKADPKAPKKPVAPQVNPHVAAMFAAGAPKDMAELARRYGELFAAVDRRWRDAYQPDEQGASKLGDKAPKGLGDPADEAVRQVLWGKDSPLAPSAKAAKEQKLLPKEHADALAKAEKALKDLDNHPGAPDRAPACHDEAKPYEARVFVRGNPQTPGAPAPRQFFEVLAGPDRKPFPKDSSGRLELAAAVVDPSNPLTARVIVNRVWAWHFGEGIVRTPSDFGFRGEPPSHPELLDWLTARFVAEGWSIKKLHRRILLSAAWRQSSAARAAGMRADPENRLLWRFGGRPLEFEAFRDSLLAVSGRLDLTAGGKPVSLVGDKPSPRRTVYGFVDRKVLPNLFRNFDFPDPSSSAGHRSRTALTPQSLFLMNSPWMRETAAGLLSVAAKPSGGKLPPPDAPEAARLVAAVYRTALQREPVAEETAAALEFLRTFPAPEPPAPADPKTAPKAAKKPATPAVAAITAWEAFAQVVLLSNEFAFAE
jgi:hypothetical protein